MYVIKQVQNEFLPLPWKELTLIISEVSFHAGNNWQGKSNSLENLT